MSIFEDAKAKIREMKSLINPTVQSVFETYEDVIIDYQVNKQLYDKGEDSKGSKISPLYSPLTVKIKRRKGQPIDRVTWKDSGNLHKNMKVIARPTNVEIITTVPYAKYLISKYGDDVIGIQEELLREFTNIFILPELKRVLDGRIEST